MALSSPQRSLLFFPVGWGLGEIKRSGAGEKGNESALIPPFSLAFLYFLAVSPLKEQSAEERVIGRYFRISFTESVSAVVKPPVPDSNNLVCVVRARKGWGIGEIGPARARAAQRNRGRGFRKTAQLPVTFPLLAPASHANLNSKPFYAKPLRNLLSNTVKIRLASLLPINPRFSFPTQLRPKRVKRNKSKGD